MVIKDFTVQVLPHLSRRYFQLNPIDQQQLERWIPVVAAARLDEHIYFDEDRLLSIAQTLIRTRLKLFDCLLKWRLEGVSLMQFLDLKDISEQFMELVNPTTPEKIIKAGQMAGMKLGHKVIDFGCGYAEPLILWAKKFGISGVGIDIRPKACERAELKVARNELSHRIEIVCGDAAKYVYPAHSFDLATCIGATFHLGDVCGGGACHEGGHPAARKAGDRGSLLADG